MSVVNKFAREGQAINHHIVKYYWPTAKENVSPSEKVTKSEEAEKGNKTLDDIKEPVFTTRKRIWKTLRGSLQDQHVGIILIIIG